MQVRKMEATTGLQPEEVINNPIEWSEIVGVGEGIVHRFWQEFENGQATVWDEQSHWTTVKHGIAIP